MTARVCLLVLLLAPVVFLAPAVQAQADTTAAGTDTLATAPLPSPRGALLRSLAVPGWGQLYNGDYLKIPVAVGGVAGLAYGAVTYHNRAVLYRRAAIFADCQSDPTQVPPGTCDDADRFEDAFLEAGSPSASAARGVRDGARRNRDLFILLTLLGHALQTLDAYVSAQLADFDVSEDLSLEVVPTPTGPAATLRWRF